MPCKTLKWGGDSNSGLEERAPYEVYVAKCVPFILSQLQKDELFAYLGRLDVHVKSVWRPTLRWIYPDVPDPSTCLRTVEKARKQYETLSLSSACEAVLEIGNAGNLYIDEHAPWSLFKQGDAAEAAAKDLVIILEAMRIIAIALSPVMPRLCLRIYTQLGYSEDQFSAATWGDTKWGGLRGGQIMAQPKPVFARIEIQKEGEDEAEVKKKISKKEREDTSKSDSGRGLKSWFQPNYTVHHFHTFFL
ncbi:methionyl-tRNA synthetase [Actinidia rufa]|uniref:Methionyl-tRNA synthetase n=1 Tax=Actinidia rufa TaxID=165716 RepID=A0A7J0ED95_9ERIC|nr:methionyl-tRNA synthetase [Actinidia rufa]